MAITKNHPIDASLKKAIDYICSPHKTDEDIYVYSYGCSPATADIEFMWTQNNENASKPTEDSHLARHFIQSFDPGETTPDVAHEIGKRLAEEVFGKYEYILATHTDRGHIHNHIIVNEVSFVNYKRIHINEKWYYRTRKISDNLCKEFGLSVITPSNNKGKSYKERAVINKGISWKLQLQNTIDVVIPKSQDFDDFIRKMEDAGYSVKRQNKNISFCADGRERYTRSKTLGEDYTIDAIKERIEGKGKSTVLGTGKKVSLLIDIQNCIKAQESKGYEHWAKINNIKQMSKTINFISDNGIETYSQLEEFDKNIMREFGNQSEKIKTVEAEMKTILVHIKNVELYMSLKPVYEDYKKAKDKDEYKEKHSAEIILFEKAIKELKEANFPHIKDLRTRYANLSDQKKILYSEYKKIKQKANEFHTVKSNVDTILGASHRKSKEKPALL